MSKINITLVKGTCCVSKKQKAIVQTLGLKKIGQTVECEENPAILGMVNKVSHLVKCEKA